MKRKFKVLLIITLCFFLTGCFSSFSAVVPNENSVTLKLEDDFASVIGENLPDFTFEFDGTLNTVKNVNKSFYTVFSNNDDIILSDALASLFEEYKAKNRIYFDVVGTQKGVTSTLFSRLDKYGKVVNDEYEPDDHTIYEETAYISLENGLKLTIDYRKFFYNGEVYYSWKYTASITMYLYYPMMAIKDDSKLTNKIVLITLPNRVTFKIGPSLTLESIYNGSKYVDKDDSIYYTFDYIKDFGGEEEATLEQQQQYIIDYYVNDFNGVYDEQSKTISYCYLGNNFIVQLLENNFKMRYAG